MISIEDTIIEIWGEEASEREKKEGEIMNPPNDIILL